MTDNPEGSEYGPVRREVRKFKEKASEWYEDLKESIEENPLMQTVEVQTAKTLIYDPAKSAFNTRVYWSEGQLHFEPVFDPPREKTEKTEDLEDVCKFLNDADHRLSVENSYPERFLGEGIERWNKSKEIIEDITDGKILDFSIIDKKSKENFVVLKSGNGVKLIRVDEDPEIIKEQAEDSDSFTELSEETFSDPSLLEREIDRLTSVKGLRPDRFTLRRMEKITNDMSLRRNAFFEREGEMFWDLRAKGACSIGELQEVYRVLAGHGSAFDWENGVTYDEKLMDIAERTFVKAGGNQSEAKPAIEKMLRESVYYDMVTEYFKENPEFVRTLVKSNDFGKLKEEFQDSHLNAYGQTDLQQATAILANYYLYKFEKSESPKDSDSQKFFKSEDFFNEVGNFIDQNSRIAPPLPEASTGSISEMRHLSDLLLKNPRAKVELDDNKKITLVRSAEKSLKKIDFEVERHIKGRKIYDRLKNSRWMKFLIDDEEQQQKPFRILIPNMGLAKVPGEDRYAISSWMHDTPYYPEGNKPQKFDTRDAETDNVEDALRYIFNAELYSPNEAELDEASARESEVSRIFTEGTVILDFLSRDKRVPENVRDFISKANSPELKRKILETYGSLSDQDPQIVNGYFAKEGFSDFQTMTLHRYVNDFVEGVRSELILSTGGTKDQIDRRFGGQWKNIDFSNVPGEVMNNAISKTLENGEHRLKYLNNETKKMKTLKDFQEQLELVFGWDTNDMKFLRWKKFMKSWNYMGGAWDCICFARVPIFNVETFQQH